MYRYFCGLKFTEIGSRILRAHSGKNPGMAVSEAIMKKALVMDALLQDVFGADRQQSFFLFSHGLFQFLKKP